MRSLVVLYGENCAYCKKAKMLLKRAVEKETSFSSIEIIYIKDNSPEGKGYVHHYVPAFFINGKRCFEGNPSMSDIQWLLAACFDTNI